MNAQIVSCAAALSLLWLCPAANAEETRAATEGSEAAPDPAPAADAPGRFERVFAYGHARGEPSAGKWITLASLYTASAGALAFAGVEFAEHLQDRRAADDFLTRHQGSGPCYDLTSQDCVRYSDLLAQERRSATLATLSLAGFGVLLLSGVLTAQVWDNELPTQGLALPRVAVSASGFSFDVNYAF